MFCFNLGIQRAGGKSSRWNDGLDWYESRETCINHRKRFVIKGKKNI